MLCFVVMRAILWRKEIFKYRCDSTNVSLMYIFLWCVSGILSSHLRRRMYRCPARAYHCSGIWRASAWSTACRRCKPRDAARSDSHTPCRCSHRPVDASLRISEHRRTQRRSSRRPRKLGTFFPRRNTSPGTDCRLKRGEKYRIPGDLNIASRNIFCEICCISSATLNAGRSPRERSRQPYVTKTRDWWQDLICARAEYLGPRIRAHSR